jgi:hypothetical protein
MRFQKFVARNHGTDTDTNAQVDATIAAKPAHRIYVSSITISASAAPAAAVIATVKSATTLLEHVSLPAAAFAAIHMNFDAPLECGINEAATLSVPALGAGVVGTVTIHGFYVRE